MSTLYSDIDGDVLSFEIANLPDWLVQSGSTLTGTPEDKDTGTLELTVTADDGNGGTLQNVYELTVGNVNDAPDFITVTTQTIDEDTKLTELFVGVSDVDNSFNELTFSAVSSNQDILPNSNINISSTGGFLTISATPLENQFGSINITLTASDGSLSTEEIFVLEISNVNDKPVVLNASLDTVIEQNSLFTYSIPSDVFSDVDEGDVLTLSIEDGYPSWLTLTGNTLSGTPGYDEIGTYTITIKATDADGLSITDTFDLEVQFVVYDVAFSATNVEVCEGELTTVEATGAIDYNWYDADGTLLQTGGSSLEITAVASGQVIIEGKR